MGIEIKNISKRFGETLALDQVNLNFNEAKIYGLLGNNGAGKTTLLNIITNRIFASDGEVLIDGAPCVNNDTALGKLYMIGEKNLYPDDFRVKKAYAAAALFHPGFDMEKAQEMSRVFGLNCRKKISSLSTGYASIFKLIIALCVPAPYLLLDEPVLGLDAQHRDTFYKMLLEDYAKTPRTIIISTHLIAEVANLIEHTVIIRNGRILHDTPNDELLAGGYTISGPVAAVDSYLTGKEIISSSILGGLKTACISGKPDAEAVSENLEIGKLNLQDYFIQLMIKEDKKND